ncbi:MAG: hypothetical protein KIT31_13870 [Deltaproteobacteria bacterium]|nr:hypothetical protein [Deltaproteobacteria bacterium]
MGEIDERLAALERFDPRARWRAQEAARASFRARIPGLLALDGDALAASAASFPRDFRDHLEGPCTPDNAARLLLTCTTSAAREVVEALVGWRKAALARFAITPKVGRWFEVASATHNILEARPVKLTPRPAAKLVAAGCTRVRGDELRPFLIRAHEKIIMPGAEFEVRKKLEGRFAAALAEGKLSARQLSDLEAREHEHGVWYARWDSAMQPPLPGGNVKTKNSLPPLPPFPPLAGEAAGPAAESQFDEPDGP